MPHIIPPRIKRCFLAVKSFMGKKARENVNTQYYTFFPFVTLTQMFVKKKKRKSSEVAFL